MMWEVKNKDVRLSSTEFEIRTDEEKELYIDGYALKFDKPSEDLGFIEYIDRNALDETNLDNVVALLNHDPNYILGRSNKNLKLEVDEVGLRFTIKPTQTSYTQNLIENMRNGLVDKCSFAFRLLDESSESWERQEDDTYVRRIHKLDQLYDISIVTTPAYEDTVALLSTRSLEHFKEAKHDRDKALAIMDMELEL